MPVFAQRAYVRSQNGGERLRQASSVELLPVPLAERGWNIWRVRWSIVDHHRNDERHVPAAELNLVHGLVPLQKEKPPPCCGCRVRNHRQKERAPFNVRENFFAKLIARFQAALVEPDINTGIA